mgnify:CR=1 FL=1
MLCKHVSCMVLEISHAVVYAKTSLLRTEKPVLDEPAGDAKTVARHRLSNGRILHDARSSKRLWLGFLALLVLMNSAYR